jgi:hypothetical protein
MTDEARQPRATGGCLCGAVRYEVRGPLRPIVACHCTQCRRQTGHFMASTACRREHLALTREDGLRWYQSSAAARRGFCGQCGSVLLWDGEEMAHISIAAGSLDGRTGLKFAQHIYVANKGDYYEIEDGLPQAREGGHVIAVPKA